VELLTSWRTNNSSVCAIINFEDFAMKFISTTFAASLVLLSSTAMAFDMPWDNDRRDRWRGDNRWNNDFDFFDDIWGDMFGDMAGDFDFEIRVRANADGWGRGRGRGRGDHYWRGDNRYYGDHRYYGGRYRPYGPYRHPGFYGAPPPVAPYMTAPRPQPYLPPAAPGFSPANRPPLSAAPATRAPAGSRAPNQSAP
jgi:hypothetical protein